MLLKWGLAAFYLGHGGVSLLTNAPPETQRVSIQSLLIRPYFVAAILIDVKFRPVGPLLMKVIEEDSSEETEAPLLETMSKSRFWVRVTYLLLVGTAFIGTTKFF